MAFVRLPPDGVGKKLYTQEHTVGPDQVHGQVVHIGDPETPSSIFQVDAYGAGKVAFAEGAPSLDAFGNLRVSDAHILGGYEHTADAQDDLYFTEEILGGTLTYNPDTASVRLTVTDANGSRVVRTTNRYHYYQPGVGMLIIATIQHGDAGKAGNERRWGFYDDDNGLYWELHENYMSLHLRSSTSGSVVETTVHQDSWNGDKLDGTGLSGMVLDPTKANFYWIDFAWLGVGTVRFGVLGSDGSRIVCHTYRNPNTNNTAYMSTASLPLRFENINEAGTSGSSEMNVICAAIYSEASPDYTYWRFADIEVTGKTITTDTPIISARSALTLEGGATNRVTTFPETLSLYVAGGDAKITLWYDPVLTDDTWAILPGTTLEGDNAATALLAGPDGYAAMTWYLGPGSHNIDMRPFFELNDEGIMLSADGVTQSPLTFAGTKLSGAGAVTVSATLTYRELR
jgi:hypothetical protein